MAAMGIEARRVRRLAAGLAILMAVADAHAQPALPPGSIAAPPAPSAGAKAAGVQSYPWQIALTDAASIAVFAGSVALAAHDQRVSGIAAVGIGASALTYVLGGAVVHGLHGRDRRALASVGLRIGAPFVGALVGAWIGSSGGPSGAFHDELPDGLFVGVLVGYGVGVVGAMIIDSAAIARDLPARDQPRWAPRVSLATDHVSLGVSARF